MMRSSCKLRSVLAVRSNGSSESLVPAPRSSQVRWATIEKLWRVFCYAYYDDDPLIEAFSRLFDNVLPNDPLVINRTLHDVREVQGGLTFTWRGNSRGLAYAAPASLPIALTERFLASSALPH